jgi:hypothetical protein
MEVIMGEEGQKANSYCRFNMCQSMIIPRTGDFHILQIKVRLKRVN